MSVNSKSASWLVKCTVARLSSAHLPEAFRLKPSRFCLRGSTASNMTVSSLTHEMSIKGILCVIVALRKIVCFVVPGRRVGIGHYS